MAVRHSTHTMIRCLCEWWKYRAKTLARGGLGAGASIARRIHRMVCGYGLISLCRLPNVSMVWVRVFSDYISMLPTTCLCAYGDTSSHPNLPEPCTIPPLPLPATAPRLRSSISGGPRVWPCFRPTFGGRLPASRGGLCGVGPRVGTSEPTSPLGRRRRYLASVWVFDAERYAHRLGAAPRPTCPNLGRIGRVSFKQSWSNNHGRAPPALG